MRVFYLGWFSHLEKSQNNTVKEGKHLYEKIDLPIEGGRFVLVPYTHSPHRETDFMLRIFTKGGWAAPALGLVELDMDKPGGAWPDNCYSSAPVRIARLALALHHPAEDDETKQGLVDGGGRQLRHKEYFKVYCEGQCTTSPPLSNYLFTDPMGRWKNRGEEYKFWYSLLLYRKDLDQDIKIQVWRKGWLKDGLVGQTVLGNNSTVARAMTYHSKELKLNEDRTIYARHSQLESNPRACDDNDQEEERELGHR